VTARNYALIVVTFAAAAFFGIASPASADTDDQALRYRESMGYFLPVIDAWNNELDADLAAVAVKPELACSTDYAELLRRGGYILDDLRGSALSAPSPVAAANLRAADALQRVALGAALIGEACDGATFAEGLAEIEIGQAIYGDEALTIRHFVDHGLGSAEGLPAPVPGLVN
jgi:hypothetical protein